LGSVGSVGGSLFDGDNQVGEESCFSDRGSRFNWNRGGSTLVDCDCGGCVWWGRRIDGDGDGPGLCVRGRRWVECDCGGWNEWFLGDTYVVFADCGPGVSSDAVSVGVAADFDWGRRWGGGCGGCGDGGLFDADVVDTDCLERVAAFAVFIGHAADERGSR